MPEIRVTASPASVLATAEKRFIKINATTPGLPGQSLRHTHTQGSPSPTWTINHNLGRRPLVSLLNLAGSEVIAEIEHTSDNQVVARFSTPSTGYANCIA